MQQQIDEALDAAVPFGKYRGKTVRALLMDATWKKKMPGKEPLVGKVDQGYLAYLQQRKCVTNACVVMYG